MRIYALLERIEEEFVDVWETSNEPLELPKDEPDVYVGYADYGPFNLNDPKSWKYWEGTEKIWGFIDPNTKEFKTYWDLDEEFDGDIPEEYDEYCKCQDYKDGKPIGEIYYE